MVLDETSCAAAETVEDEQLDNLSADLQTNVTATVDRMAGLVLHLLSLSIIHSAQFSWELANGPSPWKAELPLVMYTIPCIPFPSSFSRQT